MKKIILFSLLNLVVFYGYAQAPTKNLLQDSLTELDQRIVISQVTINFDQPIVIIEYRVERLSNGYVVSTPYHGTYSRENKEGDMKFNILRQSVPGQQIIGLLQHDINIVNTIKDLDKLQQ